MTVTEKLKKLRSEKHFSEKDIAAILGMKAHAYSRIESGVGRISEFLKNRLASLYGKDPEYFADDPEFEPEPEPEPEIEPEIEQIDDPEPEPEPEPGIESIDEPESDIEPSDELEPVIEDQELKSSDEPELVIEPVPEPAVEPEPIIASEEIKESEPIIDPANEAEQQ